MKTASDYLDPAIADAKKIISTVSVTTNSYAEHQRNVKNKAAAERVLAVLEALKAEAES